MTKSSAYLPVVALMAFALSTQIADAGQILTLGRIMTAGHAVFRTSPKGWFAVTELYPVDLDNDGNEELLYGIGEEYTKNIIQLQVFGWSNGKLQNQTRKWFPNGSGTIEAAGALAIGDFNGDGKKDFFATANSDLYYNPNVFEYSFINKGGYFERTQYSQANGQQGVAVVDINADGFDDVFPVAGFKYLLGAEDGLHEHDFVYDDTVGYYSTYNSGTNLAAGHFLTGDAWSFLSTDTFGWGVEIPDTVLKTISGSGSDTFSITPISSLPVSLMGVASHDVRVIPFKLNNDLLDDAIVFSREWGEKFTWPENSRVQLYLNKGEGQFEDVTNTQLAGYQTATTVAYSPIVVDINSDGYPDIFISGTDWQKTSNSTALLMGGPDGVLVERFRKELSAGVRKRGNISTLLKTVNGYFLATESNTPSSSTIRYRSLKVQ